MKKYIIAFIALITLAIPISVNANGLQETYNPQPQYTAEEIAKVQELEWSRQLVAHAQKLAGKRAGQCVLALRYQFGVPRSEVAGLAKNTKINSQTGKVGAVVVFKKMSWAGHVAIQITPVDANGNFQYWASNEIGTKSEIARGKGKSVIRTININDRRISGYRIINYV